MMFSLSFLAVIAFFVNGLRTDGPTDEQTKPLIEMCGYLTYIDLSSKRPCDEMHEVPVICIP